MVCCPLTTSRAKGSSCSTNGSSCFIMGGPWFLSCPSREPTAPFSGERLSSASSGAKRCVMGDTTGLHSRRKGMELSVRPTAGEIPP
jgi:hypothetical protein